MVCEAAVIVTIINKYVLAIIYITVNRFVYMYLLDQI